MSASKPGSGPDSGQTMSPDEIGWDPDDAPELDEGWFAEAELRRNGTLIDGSRWGGGPNRSRCPPTLWLGSAQVEPAAGSDRGGIKNGWRSTPSGCDPRRTAESQARADYDDPGRAGQGKTSTMGKITGFLEFDRQEQKYQLAADRVRHFREFTLPLDEHDLTKQAARCMDCGIPFCHGPTGCPVHNQIPDWNDLVFQSDWEEASRNLHSTNNFPSSPAGSAPPRARKPARSTSRTSRCHQDDRAGHRGSRLEHGLGEPEIPEVRTGKRVAVIGSGPAGMAAAQQLARRRAQCPRVRA